MSPHVRNGRGGPGFRGPSGPLTDLVPLVGHEAVGLAMDTVRGVLVRCVDEAVDMATHFVDPVVLVVDAVLALDAEVGLVRLGNVFGLDPWKVVAVHVERHGM